MSVSSAIRGLDSLGERLRAERDRLGWTRQRMSEIGQVSRASQSLYDSSSRVPTLLYFFYLAEAGADLSYLFVGDSARVETKDQVTLSRESLERAYQLATESLLSDSNRVLSVADAKELFMSVVEKVDEANAPELNYESLNEASRAKTS